MSKVIKIVRECNMLTTTELASLTGFTRTLFYEVESGTEKFTPRIIQKVANELKIKKELLLELIELEKKLYANCKNSSCKNCYKALMLKFLEEQKEFVFTVHAVEYNTPRALRIANELKTGKLAELLYERTVRICDLESGRKQLELRDIKNYSRVFNISMPEIVALLEKEINGATFQQVLETYLRREIYGINIY